MIDSNSIHDYLQQIIKDHPVVLFMKGTAQAPSCGFSNFVVQVLNKLSIDFKDINVLENAEIRQGIKDFSNWPTIPQLYVNEEFIGGADIVRDLYQTQEIFKVLDKHNVTYLKPAV